MNMNSGSRSSVLGKMTLIALALTFSFASELRAQDPLDTAPYSVFLYKTNYALYPFVQAYIRTVDQKGEPMEVSYDRIGVMVKGRMYSYRNADPLTETTQYSIQTLKDRQEGFRTVIVWDCSKSMEGAPFADARAAIDTFINAKRANDLVAVIAIRDTQDGYQLVSGFEKNGTLLNQRLNDVKCDGMRTHLYDAIGGAVKLCMSAAQAGLSGSEAESTVLNTIIVMSDGMDEGSATTRSELLSRIHEHKIVPVFSLGYTRGDPEHLKNLKAISDQTFGRYWGLAESRLFGETLQKIHYINNHDYVVTFRSYVPVDGEMHKYQVGLRKPGSQGDYLFQEGEFQAIDVTPVLANARIRGVWEKFNQHYPLLPQGPWLEAASGVTSPYAPTAAPAAPAPVQVAEAAPPPAPAAPAPVAAPAPTLQEKLRGNVAMWGLVGGLLLVIGGLVVALRRQSVYSQGRSTTTTYSQHPTGYRATSYSDEQPPGRGGSSDTTNH